MHLFTAATALVMISTNFAPSICLKFVSSPQDRQVFVLGKNTTNVVMSWKFTIESQEFTNSLALTRLKSADDSNPPQLFAYSFNPGVDNFDANFYNASKDFKNGPSSGSFNFTIKDMLKQINNEDGSPYTPLSTDYEYKLEIIVSSNKLLKIESRVTALVYAPPVSPALQVDKTAFCINATVNITCTPTTGNPPNTTVMFYNNDVKIREVKNDREAKATVSINLDKSGIQAFTCQAANLVGSSKNSSLLNITVKDPPTITQCDNQTSTEGEAFSWTCEASESKHLNTSWIKGDGNTIVSSTKTYNISSVNKSHAGMYRVTVSNGDECPTASTTVYLAVQYKPEQLSVVNSESGFLYVNKGQPISITCTAIGNPKPDYVWRFKGKQLHSSINSTIVISNATLNDAGMYTCTAINSIGRESINVTLQVNYLMDASCGPKIHTVNDGDNVTLNCSAIGIPAVNYTWTVNNKVSQGPTTTFVATRSLNGSIVTCATKNAFGNKKCSKTLIVYYKPDQLTVINAQGGVLYVNKGQPINITCNATGNPQPDYVWSFKGKQLHSSINSTIAVSNATLDDAGMYTCTAINSIGRESINVTLQVNYLMDASCGPKIHTVNDGDNVALNCSAVGIPAVNYMWTVNNQVSQEPTTTFAATRSLNGSMVTCTAMNSFGNKTCSKTLIVYFKPENLTVVNASKGTLDVDEGQLIDIICNADGYPDPYFLWQKSGQMIQSSNNKNNTITISNATSNDAGVYTCTAVNLVGSESIAVTLRVKYIGNAVCTAPASANEGDAIALNCSADGYPAVNYTWTTPDKVHEGPTASIPATPDLNGVTVTCKATNTFEMSTCTRPLTVYYKPRNVTVSPSRLVLNETETLNLTCDASANPAGNYSWSLNGKILEGESNRVLTKHNITVQDAGEYICKVNNTLGADTSDKAVVDVPHIGAASCTANPDPVLDGNNITLKCSASGYPAVNYNLTVRNLEVSGNAITVKAEPSLNGAVMTCKAVNKFGTRNCTKTVTVHYKPYNIQVSPTSVVLNEKESFNLICNASANPPGEYSWSFNGNVLDGETDKVLAKRDITRDEAGDYRCTVTNSVGSGASNTCVVKVRYLEECKTINDKYVLGNKQKLTLSPKGFPEPKLNCAKGYFNQTGNNYTLSAPEVNDNCTISNAAGKCQFEYEVVIQVAVYNYSATFRLPNREFQKDLDDKTSTGYKKLKEEIEKVLKLVYEGYKVVINIFITAFREGSVNVDFNLELVANVSDPLSPLKNAVANAGGNLSGLVISSSSIQAGTTPTPTTPIPTTTKTPITTPSPISEEAIIAIAVVVPIVVILIIVLVWYFCCKKKEKRGEENISLEEGSPYRQVNGEENRGLSESQTSYAQSGPKSDHNGQTTNNNPDTSDATATYAAVDMSKRKKKKQEGEVLYADLGSMRPGNNKGTELQPMSSSGNIPDKRESDYASIDFFKTQKQGEVKEYECLGTFTFTDRKYNKALDNEMTDSFKKLRDEVNKTVKSAYKDDTNFVLVEAEHFKSHPHGTIVIFKLILKEEVVDPFLPLKEALKKNGGVVGAMKIIPQSVQEHEEEQNATGEQKKAQKQDEANAAAKHNVGFLGGKETESSNQDNSSPESQADMSASRDNTTMTTVSL